MVGRFRFTGNPFVDAGIAGMCAAATVDDLQGLDEAAIVRATDELLRLMTSDSVFKKRPIGKRETAFATSEMTVIFPNGPLSQASFPTVDRKRLEYRNRISRKTAALHDEATARAPMPAWARCFVDGGPASTLVGNDEFPLVDSKNKRNFHPGLQAGHCVGAPTALALEFFPLSVLRTGNNSGFFWFVHTAAEPIAIACAQLTRATMNQAIVRNDGLGFFGDWDIPSREISSALVALVRDLVTGANQQALSWKSVNASEYPVTAYVFSNDNRGASLAAHDLPHQLFMYFQKLRQHSEALRRFTGEVLRNEKYGFIAARCMLARRAIVSVSCAAGTVEKPGRLRGGWQAHADYATEVLEMNTAVVRDAEAISQRIVACDEANSLVLTLQKDGPTTAFLRLSRLGIATFDEYSRLVPPGNRTAPFSSRDYLLAAIYERQSQADQFICWEGEETPASSSSHPVIELAVGIGQKLTRDHAVGKRAVSDIARAKRLADLRGSWLRLVRQHVLTWADFIHLCPPDEVATSFTLRDYILAYLYSALKADDLPSAEPIDDTISENGAPEASSKLGGGEQ